MQIVIILAIYVTILFVEIVPKFLIMDSQGEFVASKETVDSLKLEASILTPKQERQVKIVAKRIASEFTQMYSQFISPDTLEKTKGVGDNPLMYLCFVH